MEEIFQILLGFYPYIAFLALALCCFFAGTAVSQKGFRAALPEIRNNLIAAVAVAVVMPFLLGTLSLITSAIEADDPSIFTDGFGVAGDVLVFLRWPLLVLTLVSLAATWVISLSETRDPN